MDYNTRMDDTYKDQAVDADGNAMELKIKITKLNYGLLDAKKEFDTAKPEDKELYQQVIKTIEQKIIEATTAWCCARGERDYYNSQHYKYSKLVSEARK